MTATAPKVPANVQVGPTLYTVSVDQAEIDRASVEAKAELDAGVDHSLARISISPALGPDRLAIVLMHEVIHACNCLAGLNAELEVDDEEAIATRLAPVFVDLLRRNPDLVTFIVG